jgi:hypothetical protein
MLKKDFVIFNYKCDQNFKKIFNIEDYSGSLPVYCSEKECERYIDNESFQVDLFRLLEGIILNYNDQSNRLPMSIINRIFESTINNTKFNTIEDIILTNAIIMKNNYSLDTAIHTLENGLLLCQESSLLRSHAVHNYWLKIKKEHKFYYDCKDQIVKHLDAIELKQLNAKNRQLIVYIKIVLDYLNENHLSKEDYKQLINQYIDHPKILTKARSLLNRKDLEFNDLFFEFYN